MEQLDAATAEIPHAEHGSGVAMGLELHGDETLLRLVLQNLASNAIRYGAKGGTVQVGLATGAAEAILSVGTEGSWP